MELKAQSKQIKRYWALVDKKTNRFFTSGGTLQPLSKIKCLQSIFLLGFEYAAIEACKARNKGGDLEIDPDVELIPMMLTAEIKTDYTFETA